MKTTNQVFDQVLFERLCRSRLFATYQQAFRAATGMPIRLVNADSGSWCPGEDSATCSRFCEVLNGGGSSCESCRETNRRLMERAATGEAVSCRCFSGMTATAVPVKSAGKLLGFLRIGQVFTSAANPRTFDKVAKVLQGEGFTAPEIQRLEPLHRHTRRLKPESYRGMVELLATFAEQLAGLAEKLVVITGGSEPAAVTKAREFIAGRLSEPLPLAMVARKSGLSESHFCRVFREATGSTLTEYINRSRVEWAKRELLNTEARVSEIAFLIGYQSLSQFNRSFSRITGSTPSHYRVQELARLAS